ncbi:MAG: mannosyl-oligosaccharide alpha-1,2-mannosidase [Bogoriella megaspora]|nr:MAG: mannosyl-oligosaccharide alpha-1,2-mannosidase [Bogoriella megaspora]
MNSRDPFNIRNSLRGSSPSYIIHPRASRTAAWTQGDEYPNTRERSQNRSSLASEASSAPTEMSHPVSRNVPTHSDLPRRYEQAAAANAGQVRTAPTTYTNGVAEKLGSMFGEKNELPLYKDKPYSYASSERKKPLLKQKRFVIGLVIFVLALLYWSGFLHLGSLSGDSRPRGIDWNTRRERVKDVFKITWKAYEDHAWGYDRYLPLSKKGRQIVEDTTGLGSIIVDALDTLMIMNLTAELSHARDWISTTLTYDIDSDRVETFETITRLLGGLLSAHYLSTAFPHMAPIPVAEGSKEEDLYREKAAILADKLLGAFESPSELPLANINLRSMKGVPASNYGGSSSTASAGSIQLEMKYVAKLTGEKQYWETAEKVMSVIDSLGAKEGLLPAYIDPAIGTFQGSDVRLGSGGNSYYEDLIKQYLQTSTQETVYLDLWKEAFAGIRKHLITLSSPSNFTIIGERAEGIDGALTPKMTHSSCSFPGTIALALTGGRNLSELRQTSRWHDEDEEQLSLAKQLIKTCYGMYRAMPTGLAPDIVHFKTYDPPVSTVDGITKLDLDIFSGQDTSWRRDYIVKAGESANFQRPETVESLFYLYRITGDELYRHWGWEIFKDFLEYTDAGSRNGYTSLDDVTFSPPRQTDNMQSSWLAETLKWFYLLFGPEDFLSLDQVVFNGRAHAFPRFELSKLLTTGWARKKGDLPRNGMPKAETTKKIEKTEGT